MSDFQHGTSAILPKSGKCEELFDVVRQHAVKVPTDQRYPLKDAARVRRVLENCKTPGSTIFQP